MRVRYRHQYKIKKGFPNSYIYNNLIPSALRHDMVKQAKYHTFASRFVENFTLKNKPKQQTMKKQFLFAVLGLMVTATVLDSYKKGENDPFMSLRSRKSRMAGEWTITKGEGTSTTSSPATSTTWTLDGTALTTTATVGSTTYPPVSSTLTTTFTIEKDGTYKMTSTETAGSNTDVTTESGIWNFTGKVGEYKNKDHVVFSPLVSTSQSGSGPVNTTTYTGDDSPSYLFYIDQLKNKEMILMFDGTTVTSGGTSTNKGSWTLTQ
jgi:hypothetical protein